MGNSSISDEHVFFVALHFTTRDLHNAGMKRSELIKEYELTPSTFDKWVRQAKLTGSFKSVDNMTDEQRELIQLRKRNKELEMQLDILKQAAVIMARKDK
ncbi:transposase [Streptococcus dysgalactiae]|nr:transposase [Streptococcus dysgalactiae]